ncbi:MAG: DUF2231 domain-containing protein [Gemmatimonadales bacterium]|nr:DUF2231 domain-containing protein [Gemmatimonadales bacterium]
MLGYDWPRLHAALNDLPVALLLAAVLFELAGVITKRAAFRSAGFWTLMLGAVGGAVAVVSGLQAEAHISHGDAVHRAMETHEELGLITLGIFGVLALWRLVRENRMGSAERAVSLAVALGGAAALFATGMYGGRLIFEHAAGIPTGVLQAEIQARTAGHEHAGGGEDSHDSAAHDGDHDHAAPPTVAESAAVAPVASPASDSAKPTTHTHAPGTPPHKD